MRTRVGTVLLLAAAAALPAGAVERSLTNGVQTLTQPDLYYLDHHDVSPPLRDMAVIPPADDEADRAGHPVKLLRPPSPVLKNYVDPLETLQRQAPAPQVGTTAGVSFDGLGIGLGTFSPSSAPPDTVGAVGATQYVQWVNSSFAVFNKTTGALVFGPAAGNTLWSGFGGVCQSTNDGDPIVLYDKAANRWVMTQFSVSGATFAQCVAVSTTSDATGTYRRFAYTFTDFNDYPKGGVWPDGYYITFNMFNAAGTAFLGSKVCAVDRNQMITASGTPGPIQCFQLSSTFGGLLPSDLDGATAPPAGSPNYHLAFDDVNNNGLNLWKFSVNWATPSASTFTGPTKITSASFAPACGGGTCIPQGSTTQQLDSLADRLMNRLAYRNFGTHEALVVNHSVQSGTTASGVRWYEVRSPNGTPTLFQQGTFSPDATARWMGSIAQDRQGNMLMGYSASSSSVKPGIRYTGRLVTDAAGTMQAENTLLTGGGAQTGGLSRWGDYSAMTIDPSDDCTFYFTTEYLKANGSFNWSTRVAAFKFPGCGATTTPDFSVGVSPSSVSVVRGASTTTTVTVTSTGGFNSAVTLSATGLPAGVTASFSPASVTPPANGSSTATLTLTASASATLGSAVVTVTGTSGSTTRSASLSLTVNSGGGPVTVFSDGAESATTTLTFSNTTSTTLWTRNSTSPFAGTWRWKVGSSTGGNYGNSGDARMTTPILNLGGASTATLTYAFKHSTEASFDFFQVRISTDGGTTWTNLVNVSGNSSGYSAWAPVASINLNAYVGLTNVRLQFRFTSDGSVTNFGAAVDEIKVVKQ